ncbi:hypothetical protein E2P81_ATG12022 [Venturia nashicola]|uniref:Uncharacterized protein n=1 Tax=Venturia nashicola TaxID=86259 RepID=A0A4Z1P6K9_9PEZI|nr:hypothetical protein E6O75_ATG11723 [Venturia nashicola]TLD24686.1 hypothetical protein E2P81_ATG12022 [Venturia nashicola]
MAGQRPSSRGDTTSSTAGGSSTIDLKNDSPPHPYHSAASSKAEDPQGTPDLQPTPTLNQQLAQGGSSMHNMDMQIQQRLLSMGPQERLACIQRIKRYRQLGPQMQAPLASNGQQRHVRDPNYAQDLSMGMGTGPGSRTVCLNHSAPPDSVTRDKVNHGGQMMIAVLTEPSQFAQQSLSMPVMENSPHWQQYGSRISGTFLSMPQSQIVPNSMAQCGQMPYVTGRPLVRPSLAQQQQHGQHQMQRRQSAMVGSAHYKPEQLGQMHEQSGAGAVLAQHHQQLSANGADFNTMPCNPHHTAGPVSLSSSTQPQPGQKRPLHNASSPPPKRHASQSMNGPQGANILAQTQQLRKTPHTPDAMYRANSMSAAMPQLQNPLTLNAVIGGNNISAMMNQMGGSTNQSPERYQQLLAASNHMQHQQLIQSQQVTQNQPTMRNREPMLNRQMMQNQQPMQNQRILQYKQGAQIQQGVHTQQGAHGQQQGMQNHTYVQNRRPTQQQFQVQGQQPQIAHSLHNQQLIQSQQHQKTQQESSINEQQMQIPHQSSTQVGVNSDQHPHSVQHQQRVPNAHQSTAQNGDSRQPQTPSIQVFQQAQAQGRLRALASQMIRQFRNQRKQSTDMKATPATREEMSEVKPYLERFRANYFAKSRHNAAAQVAAPNQAQFLQQNFAPQQQTTPRQLEVQQQLAAQKTYQQKGALDQQKRAPQECQDQQQFPPDTQLTLTQQQPVQQPQTLQQLGGEQQKEQVAAVSGTPRAPVYSTSASLVVQNKHPQGLDSSSPSARAVTNPYPSPDREGQLSSSPLQQKSAQNAPPKDDVEVRLEEGIKTFLRESASPEENSGQDSSSSQVAIPSLAPQLSQHSTSSTPVSAMAGAPQSGTGASSAQQQQRTSLAPGPVTNGVPVQQAAVPSPSTPHTDSVTARVGGEQSRPSPECKSSHVPSGMFHGEISTSGAGISASIEGASGDYLTTSDTVFDFNSITNPGGDWQLVDRAENGYGLFDQGSSPTLLPHIEWDDAAPLFDSPIKFPGEDVVDRFPAVSLPADMSDKRRLQDFKNFLCPEAMTAGERSDVVQDYGYGWNERHWDCVSDIMAPNGTHRCDQEAVEGPEPVVEPEPVFASHTGPYTSAADVFNHRMNQELGVGCEAHSDPNLFPNRGTGLVDSTTLQMIEDGTYVPTIFEIGNVNDGVPTIGNVNGCVARPSANGEVDSGKE